MAASRRESWPRWARWATGGWVLSPLLVLAVLAGGFVGYGVYTRHQPTTYARGGDFGLTQTNGQSPTAAGGTKRSGRAAVHKGQKATGGAGRSIHLTAAGSGGGGGSAGSSSGGGGSGAAGHGSTGTSGGSTSPTGGGTTGGSTAIATPAAGAYTLAVSGSEHVKFGPVTGCTNRFPSRASLDVHHAAGEPATSYDFDLRLYPGSPNKHDERHIYSYSKNAVSLSYEQATVTCSGVKQSTAVEYSPDQVRVRLPLQVGASWHNHGGGADRTETGTSRVVRRTSLSVSGRSFQVYEITTQLTMSGKESGSRNQTWWYSPDLGMPLKISEAETGKRSGATYSDNYTATVVSLP